MLGGYMAYRSGFYNSAAAIIWPVKRDAGSRGRPFTAA
jgi:hypothetical protein